MKCFFFFLLYGEAKGEVLTLYESPEVKEWALYVKDSIKKRKKEKFFLAKIFPLIKNEKC